MTIKELIIAYLRHLQVVGRSPNTLKSRKYDLNEFRRFLEKEEVYMPEDLTDEIMKEYQEELAFRITAKGKPLAPRSQAQLLGVAKSFTRYLKENDYILYDPGYLILNRWGKKMFGNGIWCVVKRYSKIAGLKNSVTTHTFRHTCATHMLRNGAPVRHLQEMLGHESLESTQIYTRVTINDLKDVHSKYHPGENDNS